MRRVLAMGDYTLILGMPGAGKTSTLVEAIKALVAAGRSVLLSAYTNSAVDNVLLKLAEAGVAFVRLGRPGSVHPDVQGYLPGGAHNPGSSVAACRDLALTASVVRARAPGFCHDVLHLAPLHGVLRVSYSVAAHRCRNRVCLCALHVNTFHAAHDAMH